MDRDTQYTDTYGCGEQRLLPMSDHERNESGLCPNKIKQGGVDINNLGERVRGSRTDSDL